MRVVLKILKLVRNLILNSVFALISLFIKRDDNLWVIGGWFGQRFADNSMYLFNFINEFTEDKAVWITRNRSLKEKLSILGIDAHLPWSLNGILISLKAKYHIIDQVIYDINPFTSFGATKVQLWHGIPMKKIGRYIRKSDTSKARIKIFMDSKFIKRIKHGYIPGNWHNDNIHVLVTSEFVKKIMCFAFGAPESKAILANYPRNEILINKDFQKKLDNIPGMIYLLNVVQELSNENTIIGYFPTFRDSGEDSFLGIKGISEFNEFVSYLKSKNMVMLTKLHYAVNITGSRIKNRDFFRNEYENLVIIPDEMDLNALLMHVDLLITDYSGVMFDYLWLDRPIVFYPYDLSNYSNLERGLILDYEEFTPGKKAYNLDTLKTFLNDFLENRESFSDEYRLERKRIREMMFETSIGCEEIIRQLKERKR